MCSQRVPWPHHLTHLDTLEVEQRHPESHTAIQSHTANHTVTQLPRVSVTHMKSLRVTYTASQPHCLKKQLLSRLTAHSQQA